MTTLRKPKFFQLPVIKKPLVYLYMKYLLIMALILPDKLYLKWKYKKHLGKKLNLDTPILFQEKLHWLKLHDRKHVYHQMVDKFEAKKFIAEHVGEEYVIPTLGVWDRFEDIDFDKLPNQFILKCTFDSGSYYICKDKSKLNIAEVKQKLLVNWNYDYYIWSREWPYKCLKHRIIAEPLIASPETLREYKFFCFNGEPKLYQTCSDRNRVLGGAILHFYDIEGCKLDLQDAGHSRHSEVELPRPINLQKMIDLARRFSSLTYFLRVDFFEVNNRVYCGEFTFYENGGWCWFKPEHWNKDMGDWIKLPYEHK